MEESVPHLSVNISQPPAKTEIVEANDITSICKEILSDIRTDGGEIDKAYCNFAEMVFNGGDPSTASKEALVNLLKLKADQVDKKSKVMELLLRAFLKDNSPKIVSATQNNEFRMDNPHRKMLESLSLDHPEAKISKKEVKNVKN